MEYSPSFEKSISRVLSHEGGYANNPLDPGRETMWGITARVARENGYKGEMRFMPREEAIRIYHSSYWLPTRCEELHPALAFQLFDAAVNSGPTQAIRWLQKSVGVTEDGIFGPITLSAVKGMDYLKNPIKFLISRGEFLTSLPTWPAFGKGWTRRILTNISFLLEDLQK